MPLASRMLHVLSVAGPKLARKPDPTNQKLLHCSNGVAQIAKSCRAM